MHSVYEKATLESLRTKVAKLLERSGFRDVVDSITQIANISHRRSLADESAGIVVQSKRVGFDLRYFTLLSRSETYASLGACSPL